MSEPIKAGDLVIMVNTQNDLLCEHTQKCIGVPRKVHAISHADILRCGLCGYEWANVTVALFNEKAINALRVSWLKKIPPLSDPETVERKEEISA